MEWNKDIEPYYPINGGKNQNRYKKYEQLSKKESKKFFGGRLGEYKYYDMQDTIVSALNLANSELK